VTDVGIGTESCNSSKPYSGKKFLNG